MATFHRSETACRHFLNSLFQSDKIDKWSFYLPNQISGTYCPKTSTRPPSCGIVFFMTILDLYFRISNYINITTNIVRWCHLKLVIWITSFFVLVSPLLLFKQGRYNRTSRPALRCGTGQAATCELKIWKNLLYAEVEWGIWVLSLSSLWCVCV